MFRIRLEQLSGKSLHFEMNEEDCAIFEKRIESLAQILQCTWLIFENIVFRIPNLFSPKCCSCPLTGLMLKFLSADFLPSVPEEPSNEETRDRPTDRKSATASS